MARLAEARGVLFHVMALKTVCWPGGRPLVLAGAVGAAVLRWDGDAPGWFVEWEGGGCCGVFEKDDGRMWVRVAGYRVQANVN